MGLLVACTGRYGVCPSLPKKSLVLSPDLNALFPDSTTLEEQGIN